MSNEYESMILREDDDVKIKMMDAMCCFSLKTKKNLDIRTDDPPEAFGKEIQEY
jgi:hypothetical protein